jgi:hypothetical protein
MKPAKHNIKRDYAKACELEDGVGCGNLGILYEKR